MTRPPLTRSVPALAAAIVMIAGLATASAAFTVYQNDFGSKGEFKEVFKSGGAKACDRRYRKQSKTMVASVHRGKTTCSFRPPVQGDGELPNHIATLDGKILKKTPKAMRGGAFIELTVRAGGAGSGYTLRVIPNKRRFELQRTPGSEQFPTVGRDKAINRVNERNALRLTARGAKITASVNGKEVATVDDTNPAQVLGTKVRFAVGNAKQKSKPVVATFKRVAVAVP
jgi:nucleoside-triphosphatase THEP1